MGSDEIFAEESSNVETSIYPPADALEATKHTQLQYSWSRPRHCCQHFEPLTFVAFRRVLTINLLISHCLR
jgi:hypothetical protein